MGLVRGRAVEFLPDTVRDDSDAVHAPGGFLGARKGSRTSSVVTNPAVERIQTVVRLCEWLPPRERELVRAVYGDGRSISAVARLMDADPTHLRRVLARVAARVTSPEYAFVVLNREKWPEARRRVASACWVDGRSVRETARALGLSMHKVRVEREAVRALLDQARRDRQHV